MSATHLVHAVPMDIPQPGARRGVRVTLHDAGVFRWPSSFIRRFRWFTGGGRPPPDHRATWILPDDLSSVPAGRRLIHAQLAEWHFPGDTDVAELLVDELVTNALRHAWGQPVLSLSLSDSVLRCAVADETSKVPHAQTPDSCEESGRGLQMVNMLASNWGVELTRTGKAVWFELRADQPAL
ncbi:ATP-binding protein [Nonomuraea jiangxiensis]|uniref:Anti-sigma regulatory factor (Ser/Thr protein kinase) n=1 Tax=Nonomuraea jiangxiensis TaxID=633440 RepID=A0A1G8W6V8_9ACTN|nr:ATP-binding protein [Nonomuraea jiangxiensis]SDJ74041.1 Anti-sigma regulatory factor (Ser/Thr protein kinase) [Nonomuraea jiangxiensis]